MMLFRMLPAARAARRTFSTYRPLLEQGKKMPAVGPNPLDAPTLEIVKAQWKKARLAKDSDKATLLGGILTDLQYAEKTKMQPNQKPPSIIKMIQKGIKKRTDAARVYRNAKPAPRVDLAEKEEREIAILQELLPKL